MQFLEQSAIVTVQFGPFVDAGDGVVPETGLATNMDNATTGIRVSKNGATMIDRNSATAPAHDDDGFYRVALSATDTNTLGTLMIQYEESAVCLPMWKEFMVVSTQVYDSLFGTDLLDVNTAQWLGTAVTLGAGAPDVNVASMDASSIATGVLATNAIAAGSIAATALNGKGDWNIGKTGYSLTQSFPANFADLSIVVTSGLVDVTQAAADKVWGTATRELSALTASQLTAIEDEIWDALKSAHVVANSFGDFLDIEVSGRLASADINLTGGALDVVTAVTNAIVLPTIPANWITAAGINAAALDGKGNWNLGKTGYALTTADWNVGKAGYSLTVPPLTAAQVNTEVDNALDTALVEIAQGVPSATPSLRNALMLLYMALRNQLDVTTSGADFLEVHNDAGTVISKKALTDTGGDYSEAKMITGL